MDAVRIDHAAAAQSRLGSADGLVDGWYSLRGEQFPDAVGIGHVADSAMFELLHAQASATLALVEQQKRIADVLEAIPRAHDGSWVVTVNGSGR